jgi:biopolymer transport protein ExbB/TolQ
MGMNTRATGIQAAENDLKQLMADVSRAMEKAQEAIAKIASNAPTAAAETESTTSSR